MAGRKKSAQPAFAEMPSIPQVEPRLNGVPATAKDYKGHIAFNINPMLKNWLNTVCQIEGVTQGELIERILAKEARTYDLQSKISEMQRQFAAI